MTEGEDEERKRPEAGSREAGEAFEIQSRPRARFVVASRGAGGWTDVGLSER